MTEYHFVIQGSRTALSLFSVLGLRVLGQEVYSLIQTLS